MLEAAVQTLGGRQDVAYEVTAIRYATLRARKSELFYRFEVHGEDDAEVEMAYYFWLLRGNGRTILVDSGFDPAVGLRRGRTCLVRPVEALQQLGVSPDSISAIVVTHFHYDHIGNLAAFPAAELIVPRAELEFWTSPIARQAHFAAHVEADEIDHVRRADAEGRVRTTEGEEEVLPGVVAIAVGGHSPGQQLTTVAAGEGSVLLTSDAVHFYEELEMARPFAVMADLAAMYRAYDRIRQLAREAQAVVVPGHDPHVMERFAPAGGGPELAVQVNPTGGERGQ
jgi:glyoxylase-like metal-dependent hydrolase (beta-lactamase superfamily II)